MGSITEIVSDLRFGRAKLLQALEGLSRREATELAIYPGWTIKDVLAHIIGWDERVLKSLPLIAQNRAGEVPGVEVEEHNQAALAAWRDKSWPEVLAHLQSTHRQVLDLMATLDHKEIDMRRDRNGRIITIRSYVIDVMMEHDRRHAAEIEQWRKNLEQQFDPVALKATLRQNRAEFMGMIKGIGEAEALTKTAAADWSIKDLMGHITGWEQIILTTARHIHDPSLPAAPPLGDSIDEWNEIMFRRRAGNSWQFELQALTETQQAVDAFIAGLRLGDWKLRGPYSWQGDHGNIAELILYISDHYYDHLPDLGFSHD